MVLRNPIFKLLASKPFRSLPTKSNRSGVELGQTVQAGDLLASLANHQVLYVVGHAFKREASLIEQSAQNKVPVQIEFAEDAVDAWPDLQQEFQIRHLSNTIDRETRTFDFFVPLINQSRSYEREGNTFMVWRFRPGNELVSKFLLNDLKTSSCCRRKVWCAKGRTLLFTDKMGIYLINSLFISFMKIETTS